jgi:hypothetical protein
MQKLASNIWKLQLYFWLFCLQLLKQNNENYAKTLLKPKYDNHNGKRSIILKNAYQTRNYFLNKFVKIWSGARRWCLTPVIPASIQEVAVRSQSGQIVYKTLSWKYPTANRAGGVAQVVESLPSKSKALISNPITTKKVK